MVIGRGFVWAHLPKASGDATAQMFQLFPEIVHLIDDAEGNEKHARFQSRADILGGRVRALNIRRLPDWMLSYAHHVNRRGLYPDYEPQPMLSPHEMAVSAIPDWMLRLYTEESVDCWLRSESLADDFLSFIGKFTTVNESREQQVRELGAVNRQEYDHDLHHWFTEEHLGMLYRANPYWAGVEEVVYRAAPAMVVA